MLIFRSRAMDTGSSQRLSITAIFRTNQIIRSHPILRSTSNCPAPLKNISYRQNILPVCVTPILSPNLCFKIHRSCLFNDTHLQIMSFPLPPAPYLSSASHLVVICSASHGVKLRLSWCQTPPKSTGSLRCISGIFLSRPIFYPSTVPLSCLAMWKIRIPECYAIPLVTLDIELNLVETLHKI